jgi:hypothetical protein
MYRRCIYGHGRLHAVYEHLQTTRLRGDVLCLWICIDVACMAMVGYVHYTGKERPQESKLRSCVHESVWKSIPGCVHAHHKTIPTYVHAQIYACKWHKANHITIPKYKCTCVRICIHTYHLCRHGNVAYREQGTEHTCIHSYMRMHKTQTYIHT